MKVINTKDYYKFTDFISEIKSPFELGKFLGKKRLPFNLGKYEIPDLGDKKIDIRNIKIKSSFSTIIRFPDSLPIDIVNLITICRESLENNGIKDYNKNIYLDFICPHLPDEEDKKFSSSMSNDIYFVLIKDLSLFFYKKDFNFEKRVNMSQSEFLSQIRDVKNLFYETVSSTLISENTLYLYNGYHINKFSNYNTPKSLFFRLSFCD